MLERGRVWRGESINAVFVVSQPITKRKPLQPLCFPSTLAMPLQTRVLQIYEVQARFDLGDGYCGVGTG